MKAAALVPVEEYLRTAYRPDCDYVDGDVRERNLGERDHSRSQRQFIRYFCAKEHEWGAFCFPEQRIQVSARRFRVADVCVVLGKEPEEQIFGAPPFICIEILSPEDRMARVQERIDDYLKFGVPYVWVVDPNSHRAWIYTKSGIGEVADGILRTENPTLNVPLAEIF
jgi:Uma2 family endonuclease